MTTAEEARRVAAAWADAEGRAIPGFVGALLHGSVLELAADSELAATSDVDVLVVSDAAELSPKPGKFHVRGVLLDVGVVAASSVAAAEDVLSDHRLAGTFRRNCVLVDPERRLAAVQAEVARHFAERTWVERRCASARAHSLRYLHALSPDLPVHEQATVLAFGAAIATDLLMVAALERPTVRRKYAAARGLLQRHGRSDVYERLLALLGCAEFSGNRVAQHLARVASAFDAASEVVRSPVPFRADLSPAARPVAIEGSRALIEQGHPRDAVFWVVATFARSLNVLSLDGSLATFEHHSKAFQSLLEDLGLGTYAARSERARTAERALADIWDVALDLFDATREIPEGGGEREER